MSDTTTAPAAADAAITRRAERLNTVIDRLASDGLSVDSTQTPESLTEYVIEECHELVDAIRSGKTADMVEELGDVAFPDPADRCHGSRGRPVPRRRA